ncbi:murein L,D-transpeptidase [Microbulbifer sp. TYP-18]|uniref:murein L,D-transpeptidase n=1 Tax=Microbulbifer sp. TYP-18 TaxID=3230024 RepID=UPI0034C6401C
MALRSGHLALVAAIGLAAALSVPPAATPANGGEARRTEAAINPARAGAQLRTQAQRYHRLSVSWQPLSQGPPLKPGDYGPRVRQLYRIMQLYGDHQGLPGPLQNSTGLDLQRFDGSLQRALEHYQWRHGLEPTGWLDRYTRRELAVPPRTRARQLEVNADRWEKLSLPKERPYVLVNVPAYQLQLVEKGRVVLRMKTVVGKTSTRTPELRTRITNIVFNPTWTVPRNILLTELLPKARNNPGAMHRRGYRVISYGGGNTVPITEDSLSRAAAGQATLRQMGGPENSLGRVKFIVPNNQAIFLHDTQAQSLFERRQRAFSHGCVRLKEPEELAYALLRRQGWDRVSVARATAAGERVNIRVERPPRLVITYITAWVDNSGQVQFRRDIYHRDPSDESD